MHVVSLLVLIVDMLPGLLGNPDLGDARPGPVLDRLVPAPTAADQSLAACLENTDILHHINILG